MRGVHRINLRIGASPNKNRHSESALPCGGWMGVAGRAKLMKTSTATDVIDFTACKRGTLSERRPLRASEELRGSYVARYTGHSRK